MSLKTKIDEDIKLAMRRKHKDDLRALRSIKSMILLAETEKRAGETLDTKTEMQILAKAAKQRKESIETFNTQGRHDLAEKEQQELEVIEKYLPKQLSEAELEEELKKIILEVGAKTPSDIGKVMSVAIKALAGKAQGENISSKVKKLLT